MRRTHLLDLPRLICNHTLGHNHSPRHRMAAGTGVMVCGVLIAKSAAEFHFPAIHIGLDLIGYAIHGIGATPFIDYIMKEAA